MNKITALYIIIVMLLIAPQATAADYSVNLNLDENFIRTGPCSGGTMTRGTIENTGQKADTYTLTPQNNWVIITPQKLTINAGETRDIALFTTAPCEAEPKEYSIGITAKSPNSQDTETLTVDVLRVHGVDINTQTTKTECIGDKATFNLEITNTGKVEETFSITKTAGTLERDLITLSSGETATVRLDVPATSRKTVDVTVQSTTSYASAQKTLEIIGANCYSSDVSVTPESKTICMKDVSDFTISVRNTGTKKDTYTITTDFGDLSSDVLTIEPDTEKKVKLSVRPENVGRYTSNIEVKSTLGTKKVSATSNAENCKGVAVITIPQQKTVCKGDTAEYTVTIKNIGKTRDTFELSSTMGTVSEEKTTIEAGSVKELTLTVPTNDLEYKEYSLTVTVQSEVRDTSSSKLKVENCYSAKLTADAESISVCPGRDAVFTLTTENTGKNGDKYTLETSNGILEKESVEVGSMSKKEVLLTVPDNREEKSVVVNMFSEHTQDTKTLNIAIKDSEKCYGYTVNANPETIEATEYKGYLYTVTVKNTGEFASEFSVSSVGGPEWVYIDPETITLEKGSEDKFYIYVSPPYGTESGTYNIDIEIKRNGETSKTKTLKLVLGQAGAQPPVTEKEPEEREEKEEPKTYSITVDTGETHRISKDNPDTVTGVYTKDNKENEVEIKFMTGSFIMQIGSSQIEDESPELGENTYELTADSKKYTVTIEFTESNTTADTYEFVIKNMEVTEMAGGSAAPTGNATQESTPLPRNLIYATIIGLVIIILILFGPEIAEKTKEFFTEEIEEERKEEEHEAPVREKPAVVGIPLEEVSGIGGKRAEALRKYGISSVEELAKANISDIMAEAVTSEKQAKDLIKKAQKLLKKREKKEEKPEEKPKKEKPRKEVREDIKDILESI